ncbi:unnamed protein product [Parascedosporium putredinis]|uniref:Protein kinase domain-containing protein n=1 Tax=Parascedosporium putredinis TaxID=1442378 RepID=A0A9P1H5S2_9PEZI|nr:unnamed protein product [Parascedosporium putredinis]CAI7999582.1 unnamed protein product [Parascedosporium putredinis]
MAFQWWDPDRIESTVTRGFVSQRLIPQDTERLDKTLAFGDGLTDLTYWDWIDSKGKRIFLILVDLGAANHIFDLIDDSWCDDDLPLGPENAERLSSVAKDGKLWRRFYQRQFAYLLRPLTKGHHVSYSDAEMVPVEVTDRKPILTASSSVDKVALPNEPDMVFWRRRIPIGDGRGELSEDEFFNTVDTARSTENEHMVSYWASYTHRGEGFILFDPASETNLKLFFVAQPTSYRNFTKKERRESVMDWILCLADTVAFLHSRNRSHRYIKPSTVLFNEKSRIFLAQPTRLSPEPLATHSKNSFDRECLSSTPETAAISILRPDYASYKPNAMMSAPNPHLNPQAADIFSLGCIILDLLSFLLKKQSKFASFRAAKHKTPGRGGAVLDSSFHRNLGQVEAWMSLLAREASKKASDSDGAMPSAEDVQHRIYQIVTEHAGIAEPHCVHQYAIHHGIHDHSFRGYRVDSDLSESGPSTPPSGYGPDWVYGGESSMREAYMSDGRQSRSQMHLHLPINGHGHEPKQMQLPIRGMQPVMSPALMSPRMAQNRPIYSGYGAMGLEV